MDKHNKAVTGVNGEQSFLTLHLQIIDLNPTGCTLTYISPAQ